MDEQGKRRSTEAGTELNGGVDLAFSVDLRYASVDLRFTRTYLKNDFSLGVSLRPPSAVLCVQRFFNAEKRRVEDAEFRRVFNQKLF